MDGDKDILVVDDDPDMVDAIQMVLESAHFPSRSAANGKLALAAIEDQPPALVLLDMLMPVMDGWQCAKELRRRYGNNLPIVAVTAAEHVGARGDGIRADAMLSKPFEIADLLRIVRRYVPAAASARPIGL